MTGLAIFLFAFSSIFTIAFCSTSLNSRRSSKQKDSNLIENFAHYVNGMLQIGSLIFEDVGISDITLNIPLVSMTPVILVENDLLDYDHIDVKEIMGLIDEGRIKRAIAKDDTQIFDSPALLTTTPLWIDHLFWFDEFSTDATFLALTVVLNKPKCFRKLVEFQADVNLKSPLPDARSPIMWALRLDRPHFINKLLEKQAIIYIEELFADFNREFDEEWIIEHENLLMNIFDEDGNNILQHAMRRKLEIDRLYLLIAREPRLLYVKWMRSKESPLITFIHVAFSESHLDYSKNFGNFISQISDLQPDQIKQALRTDDLRRTSLHWLCRYFETEYIKKIVELGCPIDSVDRLGFTASAYLQNSAGERGEPTDSLKDLLE